MRWFNIFHCVFFMLTASCLGGGGEIDLNADKDGDGIIAMHDCDDSDASVLHCLAGQACEREGQCGLGACHSGFCLCMAPHGGLRCDRCSNPNKEYPACDTCANGWEGESCDTCPSTWAGENCDQCAQGWAGDSCAECAPNWSGNNCVFCANGWTGEACDECPTNRAGENCDQCASNWTGDNCSECANSWTGANCDVCPANWAVENCDTCVNSWSGSECDVCPSNWGGENCDECANSWQGSACDQCPSNWSGENCDTCSNGWTGPQCTVCPSNWMGRGCGVCAPNWKGEDCTQCANAWTGENCDECPTNWTGENCDLCANAWGGFECDLCPQNWTGTNCSICANAWSGSECDVCPTNWTGENCDSCANGWTGPTCNDCPSNWTGENCSQCANAWGGSECDLCPQNWTGTNCSICANAWSGSECDVCPTNWTGENCDSCANGWTGPTCNDCPSNWTGENCSQCANAWGGFECDQCPVNWDGPNCNTCANAWTGSDCDSCPQNWSGVNCDQCSNGWTGPACNNCPSNWTGTGCDSCANAWGGFDCDQCPGNWDGPNCNQCANAWTGSDCDSCPSNWAGTNCDSCANSWTGPACNVCPPSWVGENCTQCANAWTGPDCDVCPSNWSGPSCNQCANAWSGVACDVCPYNWTGVGCDSCAYGWAGVDCTTCPTNWMGLNCEQCADAWTGPACDVCPGNWSGPDCDQCADGWGGVDCLDCIGVTCGCTSDLDCAGGFFCVYGDGSATATLTVTDGIENSENQFTEGEYVLITDTAGTTRVYVLCDGSEPGALVTGTVLTEGSDIGAGTLSPATAALGTCVAVLNNLNTHQQALILNEIKAAIEHANGHNGTILVSDALTPAAGEQSIQLTQAISGVVGNTTITESLSNTTATNFSGGSDGPGTCQDGSAGAACEEAAQCQDGLFCVGGWAAATATITITDLTEINNGDKVTLVATDGTSHDFTAGDVAGGGTWIAETDNSTSATNLAAQINANAKFSASAASAVVTITQVIIGGSGNTAITLTNNSGSPSTLPGAIGASKTDFTGGSDGPGTCEDGSAGAACKEGAHCQEGLACVGGGAAATATIIFTGAVAAGQTLTIVDTAGTSIAYPAGADEDLTTSPPTFENLTGGVTAIAASLKACIDQAHGGTIGVVDNGDGSLTLTQAIKGADGNTTLVDSGLGTGGGINTAPTLVQWAGGSDGLGICEDGSFGAACEEAAHCQEGLVCVGGAAAVDCIDTTGYDNSNADASFTISIPTAAGGLGGTAVTFSLDFDQNFGPGLEAAADANKIAIGAFGATDAQIAALIIKAINGTTSTNIAYATSGNGEADDDLGITAKEGSSDTQITLTMDSVTAEAGNITSALASVSGHDIIDVTAFTGGTDGPGICGPP